MSTTKVAAPVGFTVNSNGYIGTRSNAQMRRERQMQLAHRFERQDRKGSRSDRNRAAIRESRAA